MDNCGSTPMTRSITHPKVSRMIWGVFSDSCHFWFSGSITNAARVRNPAMIKPEAPIIVKIANPGDTCASVDHKAVLTGKLARNGIPAIEKVAIITLAATMGIL